MSTEEQDNFVKALHEEWKKEDKTSVLELAELCGITGTAKQIHAFARLIEQKDRAQHHLMNQQTIGKMVAMRDQKIDLLNGKVSTMTVRMKGLQTQINELRGLIYTQIDEEAEPEPVNWSQPR